MSKPQKSVVNDAIKPTFLHSRGSFVSVYYGDEFMTVSAETVVEEKMTEVIALIQDVRNSKTSVKVTDENGEVDIFLFRPNNIMRFFIKFSSKQRQKTITQIKCDELYKVLIAKGITPQSQSVLQAK